MELLMQIQKRFLFFFLALIPLAVLIASLGRVFPSIGLNTKDKPQYYGNRYYEYSGLIKLWDKGGYKIFFKNWALVCG